jgi:hypothetical protein
MLTSALFALGLAILIWLACYGILVFGLAAESRLVTLCSLVLCGALIVSGLFFVVHQWRAGSDPCVPNAEVSSPGAD